MNSRTTMWAFVIIVILAIAALLVFAAAGPSSLPATTTQTGTAQTIQATFNCDGGKTIDATFMNATTSTATGNSVMLSLSDGRQVTLPQAISADGARYANADQTFVFWNVGNQATIWENSTTTFTNCITSNS